MSEERRLLAGTGANVVGLAAGVLAAVGVQVLLGRTLLPGEFGLVTVAVQVAFVAAAGARFGMDMAAVRLVAIGRGSGSVSHLRSLVDRAALVALAAGFLLAALLAATAPFYDRYGRVIALAATALPFIAVTNVYLGAARGLGQMRQTLYVFWIGQPLVWLAAAGAAVAAGGGADAVVLTYAGSWALAGAAAFALWRRESEPFSGRAATREEVRSALRFGLPRAPAAFLAQSIFWVDLWVLAAFEHGTSLDAYAAAARVSQVLLLFLTSLNLVFSPFAADLHARGDRERLDQLFKRSTRWALTATLPVLVVLFVAAGDVMHAFASRFEIGESALRILLLGQAVNVATGSVGFVLIMTGFTVLDLADSALGVALVAGLALVLTPAFGIEGTAIAAAIGIATPQLVRVVQARRRLGIQPYERSYVSLIIPVAGAGLAAVGAQAALSGGPWWASLAATGVCALVAYAALLPLALPERERAVLSAWLARRRRAIGESAGP